VDQVRRNAVCFVSHQHRFIYVQVPKVASTSIKAALLPLFPEIEPEDDISAEGASHRAFRGTDAMINKRALMSGLEPGGQYRDYFRFSFVRNPWDRLLSCYRSKVARRVVLKTEEFEGGKVYAGMPFREFAEVVCRTPDNDADPHFCSQSAFLCHPAGGMVVDFVGRFERLAEDFREVSRRLDASLVLPHANPRNPGRHYRDFYDSALAEMVGNRYREDIERFGYKL
jgi:chondroitin 4-sulfotransferase 11